MASRVINSSGDNTGDDRARTLPPCPICEGPMVLAYDRYQQKVCVCTDCHTSLTIPGSAWQVANVKRESKILEATERRRAARRASDDQRQS